MRDADKILEVLERYQGDMEAAVRQETEPAVLYACSKLRENLLEWFPFEKGKCLLQIGSGAGALTGLFLEKGLSVTVFETDDEEILVGRSRYAKVLEEKEGEARLSYVKEIVDEQGSQAFDYVVLVGSLGRAAEWFSSKNPYSELLQKAKEYVKEGGTLFVTAMNKMAVRYFSGAARLERDFTKRELEELFEEGEEEGSLRWYYPISDYRLPVSLYSDAYLPMHGEFRNLGAAYDAPRYQVISEEDALNLCCEEGQFTQFTSSYLLLWTKADAKADSKPKESQKELLFVKYNGTRKEEFQTKTSIVLENGERFVEKQAIGSHSMHIASLKEKREKILEQFPSLRMVPVELSEDKTTARFPFLKGKTMENLLMDELCGGQVVDDEEAAHVVEELASALKKLFDGGKTRPFERTEEFAAVFGQNLTQEQYALLEGDSFVLSNVDGLFENMMVQEDGGICGMDYEWVFDFPIPLEYLWYRNLYYFYLKARDRLPFDSEGDYLAAFGIFEELAAVYAAMETSFQNYVHGGKNGGSSYLLRYLQPVYTPESWADKEQQRKDAIGLAEGRKLEIEARDEAIAERDETIKKMQEIQRLTNNHVTNLEIMIRDLRHEIEEQAKLLVYLNKHESVLFKVARRLFHLVDESFPKGTRRRKVLNYLKNTLRHPAKYLKLYLTGEGRNRIAGDFAIGEGYLEHGRVVLPKCEQPLVSVIIPCYNQVYYTYECLRSIAEHTRDVEYEVIIADDVSTDATQKLDKFVKNLVISRNVTNQGFLKNCNQAAKKARGRYVMFLNNDTQVTEGWLSSLVQLIEADESIGMVGSKLVYPDGRLQEAGGIIWSDGSGWNYGRLDDPDKPEYNYVKDVDYISGAAILLSKKLWDEIGGFDERFAPAYCEDSDLAFEVRKAGYRVVYQPLSKIVHFEGISNGTDVNGSGLKRYQVENSKKLKEKWAEEFQKQSKNTGNPNPFRARERSQGKPLILVVDHYVPTFDKDAGSKTTYQYLKMFLKKGYVVKFLGDNFLHEEPYSTALQQMGIEILYGAEYQAGIWDWILKNKDEIDFAYLNRPHIATKYVDFIRENTDIKVIYYGHDLHFLRESREYELTKDEKKRREAEYWKTIELGMMRRADMSYYPSYVEENAIHAIDASIPVKAITAYVYEQFLDNIPADFARREGLLFVGGFAHPPNADAVLWFTQEIFPKIYEKLKIPFYIVGSKATEEIRALHDPEKGILVKGFVSEEELARLYAVTRIVVVPLRYGAGVKGKVVEAIYNGAAIVTTSIGAEGIPQVEEVLCVEDEAAAFAEKVIALYENPEQCAKMSQNTQNYIREHFSVDAVWDIIKEDFE
ncbi:MAG: glycosyltransferase [bacterium]|nr:glycosyltransferase [bacterium]